MKATFVVDSIYYKDGETLLRLSMGNVSKGDVGMGLSAEMRLCGIEALDVRIPRPGTCILLTIEAAP